jgi:hypothetical protein
MFLNSNFTITMIQCWILLKPVLEGIAGSLYLTVPSMNKPNQTEPATFSILLFCPIFWDSLFLSILIWSQTVISRYYEYFRALLVHNVPNRALFHAQTFQAEKKNWKGCTIEIFKQNHDVANWLNKWNTNLYISDIGWTGRFSQHFSVNRSTNRTNNQ